MSILQSSSLTSIFILDEYREDHQHAFNFTDVIKPTNFLIGGAIATAQHLKDKVHADSRIALVCEQSFGLQIIVAYLYLHGNSDCHRIQQICESFNSTRPCDASEFVQNINNFLLSKEFTPESWNNTCHILQKDFLELFSVRIPRVHIYTGAYPKRWDHVPPLDSHLIDQLNSSIMPDKAKTIRNRDRKDHDSRLIDLNEKEMLLLTNGYYQLPGGFTFQEHMDRVKLVKQFMPQIVADAYVNTANEALMGGGGTDLMIHTYAGDSLKEETSRLPDVTSDQLYYPVKCLTGDAKITSGHNLRAKYVIHVVTPYLNEDGSPNRAKHIESYNSILRYIDSDHIQSIVIGPVSTGYYGYPMLEATVLGLRTIQQFIQQHQPTAEIILWIYNETQYQIYQTLLQL